MVRTGNILLTDPMAVLHLLSLLHISTSGSGTMKLMRTGQQQTPLCVPRLEDIKSAAGFQRGDVRHESGFNRFEN